jgi:hypothetical protein
MTLAQIAFIRNDPGASVRCGPGLLNYLLLTE